MKINLNTIDKNKFSLNELNDLILINPSYGYIEWLEHELIFRSSIWDLNGNLVSAGFKKFFNFEENNNLIKIPENISDCNFLEKLDGSLLIISRFNGKTIYRTRGTHSVYNFSNSIEIDALRKKYDLDSIMEITIKNQGSLLFEWVTPSNKIVIDFQEFDLILIGFIYHDDYSYWSQIELDNFAKIFNLKRPKIFKFNHIDDLKTIKDWINSEGVCMYYNNDQSILKIKSLDYLKKHAFKNNISWKRLIALFFELDIVNIEDLFLHIKNVYDYEIMKYTEDLFKENLINALLNFNSFLNEATLFYFNNKHLTKKEYAIMLQEKYKDSPIIISLGFSLLNNNSNNSIKRIKNNYLLYFLG